MIRTELKRGTAELAILSVLEHGPLHGYEIGRQIEHAPGERSAIRWRRSIRCSIGWSIAAG